MKNSEKNFLPEAMDLPSPEGMASESLDVPPTARVGKDAMFAPENTQPEIATLEQAIAERMEDAGSKEDVKILSYEMNGVHIDVALLHGEVMQLSAHEQGLLRDATIDTL